MTQVAASALTVFPDTNFLAYLIVCDRQRGQPNQGSTDTSLDVLSKSRHRIVLADAVHEEMLRAPRGIREPFNRWHQANISRIILLETAVGTAFKAGIIPPKNDAGELSFVEILNPRNPQYQAFQQTPYIIATNDRKFDWEAHGIPPDRIEGVVPILNRFYKDGTLQAMDYKVIRDGLYQNLPQLPGVGKANSPKTELYQDYQLAVSYQMKPVEGVITPTVTAGISRVDMKVKPRNRT